MIAAILLKQTWNLISLSPENLSIRWGASAWHAEWIINTYHNRKVDSSERRVFGFTSEGENKENDVVFKMTHQPISDKTCAHKHSIFCRDHPKSHQKILNFHRIQFTVFENNPKCRIWSFEWWHFPPFFVLLKVTCLVTLFDRKLQKMVFFMNFCPFKM